MKKQKKEPIPFWNELVQVYFTFCRDKFNEPPSFDGSAPRDMKTIIASLKKRCEEKGIEWSLLEATVRWGKFLDFAFQDKWLKENFMLSNINRQKDKIFFNISRSYIKPTIENVYQNQLDEQRKQFKPIDQ